MFLPDLYTARKHSVHQRVTKKSVNSRLPEHPRRFTEKHPVIQGVGLRTPGPENQLLRWKDRLWKRRTDLGGRCLHTTSLVDRQLKMAELAAHHERVLRQRELYRHGGCKLRDYESEGTQEATFILAADKEQLASICRPALTGNAQCLMERWPVSAPIQRGWPSR